MELKWMDWNVFYVTVSILVLIIIAFVLFFLRFRRKTIKLKQELEESDNNFQELNEKWKMKLLKEEDNDRHLTDILDALPFPVHVKDVEQGFIFRYLNKTSVDEFGNGGLFKTARDVLLEENVERIHKIDQQVYDTGVTYVSQEEINCLDGRSYRTLVQKSAIQFEGRRHVLIVRWKIGELLDLQEKLREMNRQNEVILNNINAGLVYITPNFRVRWENFSKFSMHPLAKLFKVGDFCYKSLHGRDSPCPDCLVLKAMETKLLQKKELGSLEENEVMELTVIPILDAQNHIEGYVTRVDDITKQKRAYCELEKAKLKAEESDQLKSTFLANMSHEIRTPLNAIIGFSNIMSYADSEEEIEEYNRIISTNGEMLIQLIDDILDLSKIEAGFVELNVSKFDLSALLGELAITLQQRAGKEVIVKTLLPRAHFLVELDRKRIMQLVMNFATNAVKFTRKGSVTLGYEFLEGEDVLGSGSYLKIYVRDTGIGISEKNQQKLFKRFEKFDTFAQGTGLGLSIVKSIASLMGGEVDVDSKLGEGSTFSAMIPYVFNDSDADVLLDENSCAISNDDLCELSYKDTLPEQNLGKKVVLIVEDNESNLFLVFSILKDYYQLLLAHNGREAVDLVRTQKVDLVLMDLKMPEMNGIEATRKIRMFNAVVPIVALTAYAFDVDRKKIIEAGCNAFLTKPIHHKELVEQVNHFFCE